jgi:O-acetyl-ADP-ribose deacetylase (regulator of RNase III)
MTNIKLVQGDITKIAADAIVNAANTSLLGGGGVDGAIHRAGGSAILQDCQRIRARQGGCAVGEAVITTAGDLQASYVIHTVGPRWQDGLHGEPELLFKAYASCFALIAEHGIQTLAFPNISTGIYRFPKQLATEIAIAEIKQALQANLVLQQVTVVCFEQDSYHIYQQLLNA